MKKKIDESSKLQVKSKIERQQRNVEYAALTIVPSLKELYTDNIEERIARREVKHQPPIINNVEDLNLLNKGENS